MGPLMRVVGSEQTASDLVSGRFFLCDDPQTSWAFCYSPCPQPASRLVIKHSSSKQTGRLSWRPHATWPPTKRLFWRSLASSIDRFGGAYVPLFAHADGYCGGRRAPSGSFDYFVRDAHANLLEYRQGARAGRTFSRANPGAALHIPPIPCMGLFFRKLNCHPPGYHYAVNASFAASTALVERFQNSKSYGVLETAAVCGAKASESH